MKPSVLVTIPNGDGWLHKHVSMLCMRILSDERFKVNIMFPTWKPYEHNLNRCAKQVLDDNYNFWLSIDTDNPCVGNPLDRVEEDLDLVGFPTPVYNDESEDFPWYFNAMDNKDDGWVPHQDCEGLQKVDAIGSGCFLLAARVLRKLNPPWFIRSTDKYGIVIHGHDFLFSQRVTNNGMKVYADYLRPCHHFCEIDLLTMIQKISKATKRTYDESSCIVP